MTATNADGNAQATSAPTAVVSSAAAPTVTTPPAVTGSTALGSTLTASTGTWTGSPTGYTYAWSRCDATGASCAAIGGATAQTYVLAQPDVGTTLRVTVKATNSAGSTSTTTVPTAVVTAPAPPPATGCPSGTGGVNVADVTSPARLAIGQQTVTPGLITLSTTTAQLHVRVTACGGRPVQGALVFGTAIPYNQYSAPPEGTTGADGTVDLTMTQRSGFPASRHQQLLVVFIRARKPGESITGGISTACSCRSRCRSRSSELRRAGPVAPGPARRPRLRSAVSRGGLRPDAEGGRLGAWHFRADIEKESQP